MNWTLAFCSLLLIPALLGGCRDRSTQTTQPTTAAATIPTTAATTPTTAMTTQPTIDNGNGPLTTESTQETQGTTATDSTDSTETTGQ